jgi:hypothetical protein
MKKRGLSCAVFALGLFVSTAAVAQEQVWLKDRRYTEGAGIRAGDLELHPGIAAEFGYDSNFFLRSDNDVPGPIPALRLRITPSFSLSTLGPQRREGDEAAEPPKVGFRAGVAATYNEFIATESKNQDALSKQRNVGATGSLQLTILPQRPIGGDLFADFLRTVQPSQNPDNNYNRITARFGGGLVWTPGGGMFDWRLGYEYGLTYFEDAAFRDLSNSYNQVNTRGRWRFLPRTAFLYDGSLTFLRYNNPGPGRLDSDPVRARLGLNGLVTPSFAVLAMVGWGASFYKGAPNAQQFDSVIGQAEIKWFITPNPSADPAAATLALSSVSLGYTRDFFNSYLGDYYRRDRGYLNLSYFFGGRFLLVGDAGLGSLAYPTVFDANRNFLLAPFNILVADGSLFGEYRVADSFGINGTFRYTSSISDTAVNGDHLDWKRWEAYAGVRWFM